MTTSLEIQSREKTPVLFDAILTPHRSLNSVGFAILMAVVVAVNIGLGVSFMLEGAWPIFGFCGLDVLLFYVMFRLNYRSARMFERVRLLPDELVIERHDARGRKQSWSFQPYWLRIAMDDPPEHHSQLVLISHGRSLAIGSFLTAAERFDLARALGQALRSQRGMDA
ncbi:MAG TPA: DUF2244 domain-containing protein [Candidatus Acidoferrum sp.]|nr:DUF2244 domain-containing protein [Candidatus Acidoferrum sp.]